VVSNVSISEGVCVPNKVIKTVSKGGLPPFRRFFLVLAMPSSLARAPLLERGHSTCKNNLWNAFHTGFDDLHRAFAPGLVFPSSHSPGHIGQVSFLTTRNGDIFTAPSPFCGVPYSNHISGTSHTKTDLAGSSRVLHISFSTYRKGVWLLDFFIDVSSS